jgi:hypothetical protein
MSWNVKKTDCAQRIYRCAGTMRGVKMMRKIVLAIIVCLFVSMPSLADFNGDGYSGGFANVTRIKGDGYSYYSGSGGEFTLYGRLFNLSNNAYASDTRNQVKANSLQTFCMEMDELAANSNVWVSTQNAALDGPGSHAFGGGVNTDPVDAGDDLDPMTAYLYTQFATGVLSDYEYDETDGRSDSAGQLQQAIWYIEEVLPPITLGTQAQIWVTEAEAAIESKNWTGIGDVRVLQMCSGINNSINRQDFLYLMQPVPVPAAALLALLGMSVAGIKLRKFA